MSLNQTEEPTTPSSLAPIRYSYREVQDRFYECVALFEDVSCYDLSNKKLKALRKAEREDLIDEIHDVLIDVENQVRLTRATMEGLIRQKYEE